MGKFIEEVQVKVCSECTFHERAYGDSELCNHPLRSGMADKIIDIDSDKGIPQVCPLLDGTLEHKRIISLSPEHKVIKPDKPLILKKLLLKKGDVPDHMNRIYPTEVLQKIVEETKADTRLLLGCLGRIDGASIPLSQVSHVVEKLYVEDDSLYCDIRVLDTPNGERLKEMLDEGHKPLTSPVWTGSTVSDQNNNEVVQGDLIFVSASILDKDESPGLVDNE